MKAAGLPPQVTYAEQRRYTFSDQVIAASKCKNVTGHSLSWSDLGSFAPKEIIER